MASMTFDFPLPFGPTMQVKLCNENLKENLTFIVNYSTKKFHKQTII